MDTGLELLKRRLPPAFAREIEEGVREGNLISLAGPKGNGSNVRPGADGGAQAGEPAGRSGAGTLRDWLASAYEEAEGIRTDPQQWLLAESADGALDLLLRVLVPGGGTVLVETPAAPEALELMRRPCAGAAAGARLARRLRGRPRRRAVPLAPPARRGLQRSAAARFAAGRHSVPAGNAVLRQRAG
ncbi:hypothetical protein [Paenibacillus rubinfantis]|uniref:hypothetical protein n=1 Tax=Paenibacillus rubinfantis TaxID=1720296 RepID=UPI0011DD424C|nr:hypothetical protein [Paenibacillus rubinfantis]